MDAERWQQVTALFHAALQRPTAARAGFLDQACSDNTLRAEVDALLKGHAAAGAFGDTPVTASSIAALPPDTVVGIYRIEGLLGAGGMGEVYRAHDTRLGRDVAIKILPDAFMGDPDRKARFQREARLLAALNHPNIATIHGIEETDRVQALVMELVEGETLVARIARGAIPMKETLVIARQIADALDAAHQKGIIHRDLKPANVKITPGGLVKVLDFGLAKFAGDPPCSHAPTITVDGTRDGQILGTAAYMSPEQARGQAVDKRTDVWAFGCVLYEVLTGHAAFGRATVSDTIAALLEREVDLEALPADTPTPVRQILLRCLTKDVQRRLSDLGDVRLQIDELLAELAAPQRLPERASRWWQHRLVMTAIAAGAIAFIVVVSVALWREPDTSPPVFTPVALQRMTADTGLSTQPALSPDGRLMAFASDRAGEGNLDIWVQQVAGGEAIRLTRHLADESTPTFSPDGTQIAFRSERDAGGVYIMSALGGEPMLLAPEGYNPRFSPDGRWLAYQTGIPGGGQDGVTTLARGKLYIVAPTGGASREVQPAATAVYLPVWAPDSQHLLALASFSTGIEPQEWWVMPLEGAATQVSRESLLQAGLTFLFPIAWLPGDEIVFTARSGDSRNTWMTSISRSNWQLRGAPQRLTYGAGIESAVSVVSRGADRLSLAFANVVQNVDLWSVPLARNKIGAAGPAVHVTQDAFEDRHPALTADGETLVYASRRRGFTDIWTRDMATGREGLLVTMAPDSLGKPVLSADGSRLAFWRQESLDRQRPSATFVTDLRRGPERTLLAGTLHQLPTLAQEGSGWPWSWTPDGQSVWYDTARWPRLAPNLLYGALDGNRLAEFQHPARDIAHMIESPDGRWIVFFDPLSPSTARLVVAPFMQGRLADERDWTTIVEADPGVGWPAWSTAADAIYFTSARDGFVCVWAQRLNRSSMRPMGPPVAIHHAHAARLSIRALGPTTRGLAVARDKVVFNMSELTGNIWMTDLERP